MSIAEGAKEFCVDTQPGIMVVNYEFPDVLPLCITEDYLNDNVNISVISYGGYHPDELGCATLKINQWKTGICAEVPITWAHFVVPCNNPDLICYGCDVDVFIANFVLSDPIQIDSNHLPIVIPMGNADMEWFCDGIDSPDLNKWVKLSVCTSWAGCDQEDQKFKLIWIHFKDVF